jgi:hypothetical protein
MDYVIGTALHESDHMKELHLSRTCAESLCEFSGTLLESKYFLIPEKLKPNR